MAMQCCRVTGGCHRAELKAETKMEKIEREKILQKRDDNNRENRPYYYHE